MDTHVAVRSSRQNLRRTIPIDREHFVVDTLLFVFVLELGNCHFVVSKVPEFDSAIKRATQEDVINLGVELDGRDVLRVA